MSSTTLELTNSWQTIPVTGPMRLQAHPPHMHFLAVYGTSAPTGDFDGHEEVGDVGYPYAENVYVKKHPHWQGAVSVTYTPETTA